MGNGQPFTSADLRKALVLKGVLLKDYGNAQLVADAIKARDLDLIITGFRHDGKGVNYRDGYAIVFGEKLK